MTDDKTEIERLKAEVESYRQRELADLRTALAAAREETNHYRAEANRNADLGRQIHAEMQLEIDRLRSQIETKERVARELSRVSNGNSGRT